MDWVQIDLLFGPDVDRNLDHEKPFPNAYTPLQPIFMEILRESMLSFITLHYITALITSSILLPGLNKCVPGV